MLADRCRRPLPRPPCIWRAIHTADRMRGTRGKKGGILRDLKLSLEPVFQKLRSDGNYLVVPVRKKSFDLGF